MDSADSELRKPSSCKAIVFLSFIADQGSVSPAFKNVYRWFMFIDLDYLNMALPCGANSWRAMQRVWNQSFVVQFRVHWKCSSSLDKSESFHYLPPDFVQESSHGQFPFQLLLVGESQGVVDSRRRLKLIWKWFEGQMLTVSDDAGCWLHFTSNLLHFSSRKRNPCPFHVRIRSAHQHALLADTPDNNKTE